MVRQRFLTHFKPGLFAVIKAGGLILSYQTLDQIRARLQYAPLDIGDVLKASIIALIGLALSCGVWAWGEWCWFKLRSLRNFCCEVKRAYSNDRNRQRVGSASLKEGRMV